MKLLHVSYHKGCIGDINNVARLLNLDISVMQADWDYLITHDRAADIWNKHKDYFNAFDVIITSDTAPLSRIFLQNNYRGKLIVWVCNRFDYPNRDGFPDPEYFSLWNSSINSERVNIISYTPFEYLYARQRGINLSDFTIKPISGITQKELVSSIPASVDKKSSFFIPPYHNDTIYMNLSQKCLSMGIPNYTGRYSGPLDLQDFKGVIHIPYAWSNLALFEGINLGIPYLIPSVDFLITLSRGNNFFWSPPFQIENIRYSEWYCEEFRDVFVYFNSWEDLSEKALHINREEISSRLMGIGKRHQAAELDKWGRIFHTNERLYNA
jgi:hypothetical protein